MWKGAPNSTSIHYYVVHVLFSLNFLRTNNLRMNFPIGMQKKSYKGPWKSKGASIYLKWSTWYLEGTYK